MSSSESSDSEVAPEEDEEGKMYQLIFDMKIGDDKENKEEVQTPSSSTRSPVRVTINAGRVHAVVGGRVSGMKNPRRKRDVNVQDVRDKPWRKVGAHLSDFFNFGFNEASWVNYCRKQRELRAAKRRLNLHTLQKRRTAHREKPSCSASSGSSCPADLRWPIDPPAVTNAVESLRILNYSQVDMSPEGDGFTPSSDPLFAFVPPELLRFQGTASSSHLSPVESGRSQGLEDPSTPLDQRALGASSSTSESAAPDAGRPARESVTRQEHSDRHQARERIRARRNARSRDGRRCSSSHRARRGFARDGEREKQAERGEEGKRGEEGERRGRHRERRTREDDEDMDSSSYRCTRDAPRSSSSSSKRMRRSRLRRHTADGAEDQDGQSGAKRNWADEDADHASSIDQEENATTSRRMRRSRLRWLVMDGAEDQDGQSGHG